jgi:hypothetical protein
MSSRVIGLGSGGAAGIRCRGWGSRGYLLTGRVIAVGGLVRGRGGVRHGINDVRVAGVGAAGVNSVDEEAEAAGDIRADIDPKLAPRLLFGTVNSIVEWYRPGSSTSPEALADGVCAIAFDGLRVRR